MSFFYSIFYEKWVKIVLEKNDLLSELREAVPDTPPAGAWFTQDGYSADQEAIMVLSLEGAGNGC